MKITINGSAYEVASPASIFDSAREAGLITRQVIAAELNGELAALTTPVNEGDTVKLLTFEDEGGKHVFRHTASHILAQAVKRLYPAAKLTIGPAIDNGFYYDIDTPGHAGISSCSSWSPEQGLSSRDSGP